jgi:hypothetical protein
MKILTCILILVASGSISLAQGLTTITCDFYTVASPEGLEEADTGFKGLKFVFKLGDSNGVMLGNAGETPVLVTTTDDSVTFIQLTPIVTTTTIELKTLKAVHSRNTVLAGQLMPTQYYGKAVSVR